MAITVNWPTKVINIPKADTLLVQAAPTEIRQLDIDGFRLILKDLEDEAEGIVYSNTHNHNPPVTVGGVTLARVVEIINGYTVTFEDGQYAVNLVGANSNIGDVTNVNQVSIRSANSAGLTFSEQINSQSFINASVYIDIDNGLSGTSFPRGTPTDPVNNYPDAFIIATKQKLRRFSVFGAVVFSATDVADNAVFVGDSPLDSSMILTVGSSTDKTSFSSLSVSGTLTGQGEFNKCQINALSDFKGFMYECAIAGPITINSTAVVPVRFIQCVSDVAGTGTPVIDVNGANCSVSVRNYTGGLELQNFSAGNNASIDMLSGRVVLDSTCTSGTIVVRGICQLVDNSGPGCTVVIDGLVQSLVSAGSITEQDKADIANKVIPHVWAAS